MTSLISKIGAFGAMASILVGTAFVSTPASAMQAANLTGTSGGSVNTVSQAQLDEYISGLTKNLKVAANKGDQVAKTGLGRLGKLSKSQKNQLATEMLSSNPFEPSKTGMKKVENLETLHSDPATLAAFSTAFPFATAAASKTLRQTVACYKTTTIFGVKTSQIKLGGAIWTKNWGATLVSVEKPAFSVRYNYDPVLRISGSGENSWKSSNVAYFEAEVSANRNVGWAGSGKGGTLRFANTSYGNQKFCNWIG